MVFKQTIKVHDKGKTSPPSTLSATARLVSTSVPGEHPWAPARPRASCVGQNSRAGLVVTHHGTTFILPNTLPTLMSQNTGNNRKLEESSTSGTYEITGLQSQILSQKEVRTTLVTERSLPGLFFL